MSYLTQNILTVSQIIILLLLINLEMGSETGKSGVEKVVFLFEPDFFYIEI